MPNAFYDSWHDQSQETSRQEREQKESIQVKASLRIHDRLTEPRNGNEEQPKIVFYMDL